MASCLSYIQSNLYIKTFFFYLALHSTFIFSREKGEEKNSSNGESNTERELGLCLYCYALTFCLIDNRVARRLLTEIREVEPQDGHLKRTNYQNRPFYKPRTCCKLGALHGPV